MLRILQVANVGSIVGGTAACAWTVTRALPWAEHVVAFLSPIRDDTRAAFHQTPLLHWNRVLRSEVRHLRPDIVILHNTAAARVEFPLPVPTIHYLHSKIAPAPADLTVYCSAWLAAQYAAPAEHVLYQAVPIPPREHPSAGDGMPVTRTSGGPVIGRLCTPQQRKWPDELVGFFEGLARRHPSVEWEFVGCPFVLRPRLNAACCGRAAFHESGWSARQHLHRWDALLYHHPTLTESFGRTCAEAMRCGCIPIVDDRGGFREQIAGPTRPGFLCEDFTAFDRAVAALDDPATRTKIGQAARTRAERFSLAQFAERFVALLRSERLTSASLPSESLRRPSRSPGL